MDPDEVASDMREAVHSVFRAPLEAKGFSVDELEEVISYACKYLPVATESYKNIWYTSHTCSDASKWQNMLMLWQLIFSLLFRPAELNKFLPAEGDQTDRRTNLQNDMLHTLLEICVEGPPLSDFSADSAVDLWWKGCSTTRRVNQNPRKQYRFWESVNDEVDESSSSSDDEVTSFLRLVLH